MHRAIPSIQGSQTPRWYLSLVCSEDMSAFGLGESENFGWDAPPRSTIRIPNTHSLIPSIPKETNADDHQHESLQHIRLSPSSRCTIISSQTVLSLPNKINGLIQCGMVFCQHHTTSPSCICTDFSSDHSPRIGSLEKAALDHRFHRSNHIQGAPTDDTPKSPDFIHSSLVDALRSMRNHPCATTG